MNFRAIGNTMGDETTPYSVTGYLSKTVVEFIKEVIQQYPRDWGYFHVKGESNRVEYRYGKILNDIPDEWQYNEIKKVESCGGWSAMDYMIYT